LEPAESFSVNLSNAVGANLGTASASFTIQNDEVGATIAVADANVEEGNGEAKNLVFGINLTQASTQAVTVVFATADGTATAGVDYTATSGTFTFQPNVTLGNITVPVLGDTSFEQNENVILNLTSPSGAIIGDPSAVGTILDDDLNSTPWRNPLNPLDVDADGEVAPIDAHLILNELNREDGPHELPVPPVAPDLPPPFYDVTGDNFVAPIDAHRVINFLDDQSPLSGTSLAMPQALSDEAPLASAPAIEVGPLDVGSGHGHAANAAASRERSSTSKTADGGKRHAVDAPCTRPAMDATPAEASAPDDLPVALADELEAILGDMLE
jgi:hypothetical protein